MLDVMLLLTLLLTLLLLLLLDLLLAGPPLSPLPVVLKSSVVEVATVDEIDGNKENPSLSGFSVGSLSDAPAESAAAAEATADA